MCRSVENHFGTGLILSCVWVNEFVPYENLTVLNTRPQLYIIAAMSENHVIGLNNRLPWHLPDEWAHFRKVTSGPAERGPVERGRSVKHSSWAERASKPRMRCIRHTGM
jgi:hypothetical protein